MYSALKNGWSINIFYYLREIIRFEEDRGSLFLAAYQGIPEGIIFRLEKEAKLDRGWQEVIKVMA